jgi:WD40 repeat protein
MIGHQDWVYAVAFSPNSQWLATASLDKTARVWEVTTGQEVARMVHENALGSVAFSPDERWLVTAGQDGMVRVWLWRSEDLISEACARLTRNLTPEEWQQYLPGEPYRKTCPDLP